MLQRIEARLAEEPHHVRLSIVRKLVQKLSFSDDVENVLEGLYRVEEFERFALGLMWVTSNQRTNLNGLCEEILEYDVQALGRLLSLTFAGEQPFCESRRHPSPVSIQPLNEQLYRFGRFIADIKRKLTVGGTFQGIEEDILYRIMGEASALQEKARQEGKGDVERFCRALAHFLEFVMNRHLMTDVRVLGFMETANITVQTVLATVGVEGGDSLEHVIELLEQPGNFFA